MTWYRGLAIVVAVIALTVGTALAHGGAGGGAGAGGAGAGGGAAASGAAAGGGGGHGGGHGEAAGTGGVVGTASHRDADPSGHLVGAGRGTALSAPGNHHRSSKATQHLSTPRPGKANPPRGVMPGEGRLGTIPTTAGREGPQPHTGYLTDGQTLMWEYPRVTPDGEQMDFVGVMEVRNGLIHRHRV